MKRLFSLGLLFTTPRLSSFQPPSSRETAFQRPLIKHRRRRDRESGGTVQTRYTGIRSYVFNGNIIYFVVSCLRLRREISCVRVIIFRLRKNLYLGKREFGKTRIREICALREKELIAARVEPTTS